jgi:amino acid adenylation domain-containing protein
LLASAGVSRGDRVGLYLEKSVESLVGIYGALKAGAVYVPLDPEAPVSRLAYIAQDCQIRALVTSVGKRRQWPALIAAGAPIELLVVPDLHEGEAGEPPSGCRVYGREALDAAAGSPNTRAISLDLAYILYTSGSTGQPKGVMLSHRNGAAFVEWAVREFGLTSMDRLSSHAPFHFDLSIFDIFAASMAGATLVLVPRKTSIFPVEVVRLIDREQITVWYSVPSVLSAVTERGNIEPGGLPCLRTILFAGEVFPTKYLRRLMRMLPAVRFCNLYGPTETNVCTWYDVPKLSDDQTEPIPIGAAIRDVETLVINEAGEVAAHGEVGELHVRGPTVMQGYWGDDERTRTQLVRNPSAPGLQDRVYRTGDLVVEQDDGNYRFLGRRDAQIKSRGYRIELGEIEAALYANSQVSECAVLALPDDLVTNRLVAVVVSDGPMQASELVRFCSQRLPKYMVPETFEFRSMLPKTSTGKVDRQSLLAEMAERKNGGPSPTTDLRKELPLARAGHQR